ncbi:MAG: hypothetical protein LBM68_05515 [Bacteroidales bacterium]|jgi:hypothetical protein|nr:hypothetical protein [Bacteroidales bacterium]
MATIATHNLQTQSPYLYLQGAGSNGSDGSAQGIHLRWDFLGTLAENHIPKGNLAAPGSEYYTSAGFNKAHDFVKLYRTRYNHNFPVIIDFTAMAPTSINDSTCTWRYDNVVPIPQLPSNTCNVLIRFYNKTVYKNLKLQYNPASDHVNFLKHYTDIIEVEVEGRLLFSAYVQMQRIDDARNSITCIESISITHDDTPELFISSRKKYQSGASYLQKEDLDLLLQENDGYLALNDENSGNGKIMAENIRYIRFQGDNSFPTMLWLETYHDFMLGKNRLSEWQPLSELSLSVDTAEVFNRLDNSSYSIDGRWAKYTNGATVNVDNYKARWYDNSDEGLRRGVIEYLQRSKDAGNLSAGTQPQAAENEFSEECKISYLALLKLVAFDFHIARMLGFGYIDTTISNAADKYMYIAVYHTEAALDTLPAELRTHTCMTLPVGKNDNKLPVAPDFYNILYSLRMNNQTEIPIDFVDKKGYNKYHNSRAVGLYVKPCTSVRKMGGFFVPDKEFSYVDNTEPVFFGIAYKESGASNWQKPEINHDSEFQDHEGFAETVAVIRPATESNRIFTHFETQEGVHEYAIYGINWFSRVSPLSSVLQTDETVFPIRNTLVPPLNVGVQLIQKEDTLLFTTEAEQLKLQNLTSADKTLLRLTFEWNDIHNSNYWYGKEAEFFFRTNALCVLKGSVKSVADKGEGEFEIRTAAYTAMSVPQTTMPLVPEGKEHCFIGSFLTVDDMQYQVQSVQQSTVAGEGSIFTVKAPENRTVIEPDNNTQQAVNAGKAPQIGSTFAIAENASLAENWETPLSQKVTLKHLSDYTEEYIDREGTVTPIHIGGVYQKATITELLDIDNAGEEIPNSRTGMYRIVFTDFALAPHGAHNVEWYKGTVRIQVALPENKTEMRTLEVWTIESTSPELKLIARDATFAVDANYQPQEGYTPISTGAQKDVNYHPGYRVYFTHETGFNQQTLLPVRGGNSKQSLIACRSTDEVKGQKIASPLSTPAVIVAREIIEPVAPELPTGGLFATRPNFYGKSTYTFDTEVNTADGRAPYALVFYRANEQIILDALYKHETVLQIKQELAQIENDLFLTDRWNSLLQLETDDSGQFVEWNGYRFPNPDLESAFSASKNPATYIETIQSAIDKVFLPLTEQPVVYAYVKSGYQTSDRKPTIKDSNGDLIVPGSPNYDGVPMAVKYQNAEKSIVRFTDYTLDGASNSIFFYYVREMNNMLAMSSRSPILGPIQLINTAPPKSPEIKGFYARTQDSITGDTPAVLFEINDYAESDGITKYMIYRAFDAVNAKNIQTMQLAATIQSSDELIDDFSDLDFYPFGEVLYYRLVGVRTVNTGVIDAINGIYDTEDVLSYPSPLILTNIVDVTNPPAPVLTYTADEQNNMLEQVVITWDTATHNGIYRLYQMNNAGNWVELYQENLKNASHYEFTDSLPKIDDDGEPIYYRFKVVVENTAGLLSLEENVLQV